MCISACLLIKRNITCSIQQYWTTRIHEEKNFTLLCSFACVCTKGHAKSWAKASQHASYMSFMSLHVSRHQPVWYNHSIVRSVQDLVAESWTLSCQRLSLALWQRVKEKPHNQHICPWLHTKDRINVHHFQVTIYLILHFYPSKHILGLNSNL